MKLKDVKHRPLIGVKVTNGWTYQSILGTSIISKTFDNNFNLYTFNRGLDVDFYKDEDGLVKSFKTKALAEETLLRLCNVKLQNSLFYIASEHQQRIEET